MKTRNGFVSNSSSSSFVLLLPENFLETIDYNKIASDFDEEFPKDKLKELFEDFVKQGGMYDEEIYEYDRGEWDFYDIFYETVMPYKVVAVEGSPNQGQYVALDREKLKKLL